MTPNTSGRFRLFCVPYMGADVNIFFGWPRVLGRAVEICPIRLPGRGSRLKEEPFRDLHLLTKVLAHVLLPQLREPYALFGHSMGAIISFELARQLRELHAPVPAHLFVSGSQAPQAFGLTRRLLAAPVWNVLLRVVYRARQVGNRDSELIELMLPTLKADRTMMATYRYTEGVPLGYPITSFSGSSDFVASERHMRAWSAQTGQSYRHYTIPGGHLFLKTSESSFLRVLAKELSPYLRNHGEVPVHSEDALGGS